MTRLLKNSSPNLVAQFNELTAKRITWAEELPELAAHGDEHASALLRAAGERLGEGIADLANLFDPDLVILSGEGVAIGPAMLSIDLVAGQPYPASKRVTLEPGVSELKVTHGQKARGQKISG